MKRMKTLVGAAVVIGGAAGQSAVAQSAVHAIDLRLGGRLLNFDPANPQNTQVGLLTGLTPRTIFGLDFNEDGSTLYAIDFSGVTPAVADCRLGTLDFTTGVFTPIAQISGAAAAVTNFASLSYDAATNTWYTSSTTALYTIDIATANTTLVGNFSGVAGAAIIAMTIDNNGNMYGHDFVGEQIVSINKATGALTALGPTGYLANFAQGMDVDPATNTIYAHIYVGGGVAHWVSITPSPFQVSTILTTTAWNSELEFAIKGDAPNCYADCNTDGALTVADFGCFQTAFVGGNMYADCNADGALTVPDFGCFQTKFVTGCP